MNDRILSQRGGKTLNYLAEVKHRSVDRYELIKQFGGIDQYIDECNILKNKLAIMHTMITESYTLTFVGLYRRTPLLQKQYTSSQSFTTAVTNMAFSVAHKTPTARVYHNMKNIVDSYKVYISEFIKELQILEEELR